MKKFLTPFSVCLGLFLIANILSYFVRSSGHGLQKVNDGIKAVGFPFMAYEEGGFSYRRNFFVLAFVANTALALCISAGVAWNFLSRRRA